MNRHEAGKKPRADVFALDEGDGRPLEADPCADTFLDFVSLFASLPEEPFDLTAKIMERLRALAAEER